MDRYYYIDAEGKQNGPFTPRELMDHPIRRDTLVWTQGMDNWITADKDPHLSFLFSENAEAVPPPHGDPAPMEPLPRTWLIESILVTILPFMLCGSVLSLLGIVGVVYASQVEALHTQRKYSASLEASRSARKWTLIALWIFIGWILLWLVGFLILFGVLGLASFSDVGNLIDV